MDSLFDDFSDSVDVLARQSEYETEIRPVSLNEYTRKAMISDLFDGIIDSIMTVQTFTYKLQLQASKASS